MYIKTIKVVKSVESEVAIVLYGGYDYTVDKKGRVAIPAKLRAEFGETFMISKGIFGKNCLCVYSNEQWDRLVERIGQLPSSKSSAVKRYLYDGAFSVEFDSQGRILIPQTLREFANLESEAHIIGVDTNLEIWDKATWQEANQEYTPEAIAAIVNELDF